MDLTSNRSDESTVIVHDLYALDFCEKRIVLPNTMKFVIGRSTSSDLIISSPRVSRKHCEIIRSEHGWQLHNFSPDGTSLVGRIITRFDTVQLENDDILKLGNTVFIQCKMHSERVQTLLEMRVLRLVVLIGEDICSLASEPGTLCLRGIRGEKDDSVVEIPHANILNKKEDNVLDDTIAEKPHIMKEFEEAKAALKAALIARVEGDLELAQAKRESQQHLSRATAIEEGLETELQCSICNELLVNAVTINCSHTFCEYCLREWKKKNKICPLCRTEIKFECKTRTIDSLIDRLVGCFSEGVKNRRAELVESRKAFKRPRSLSRRNSTPKRRRTVRDMQERFVRISVNYGNILEETIDLAMDDSD